MRRKEWALAALFCTAKGSEGGKEEVSLLFKEVDEFTEGR